jgi:hypothetical protein
VQSEGRQSTAFAPSVSDDYVNLGNRVPTARIAAVVVGLCRPFVRRLPEVPR